MNKKRTLANAILEISKAFKGFSKIENVAYGNLICLTPVQQPLFTEAAAISIWDI
jgi:hypothetical protein